METMWIFRNNIDKLPKRIDVNGIVYNLTITANRGYTIMYLNTMNHIICEVVNNKGYKDMLIIIDDNFNKAVKLMLKKLKEYTKS